MTTPPPAGFQTPEPIANRPALSAVSYRVGRYATFLESMLTALSRQSDPLLAPIAGLRTRDPGDFSVALLDAWAVVLDILTFYSERAANEAYLRTAVEQRSVTELAALIGYLPSPGVSASATLTFTLSAAPGAPPSATIPAGSRVQSIPGPGQTAVVFETSADLAALAQWNALPAAASTPWSLSGTEQSTWITGTSSNVRPGDALLFVSAPDGTPSAAGPAEFHYVTAVAADPVAKATQLTWDVPLSTPALADGAVLYAFGKKAALFGANAPSPAMLAGPNVSDVAGWPSPFTPAWDYQAGFTSGQVILDAAYPGLTPAAAGPPQWLALTGTTADDFPGAGLPDGAVVTALYTIGGASDGNPGLFALSSRATTVTVGNQQVLADGAPAAGVALGPGDATLQAIVARTPKVTAYAQSTQLTGAPLPVTDWTATEQLYPPTLLRFWSFTLRLPLMPGHPAGALAPVAGPVITVAGGQQVPAGQPAGVAGKRMRLHVAAAAAGNAGATFTPAGASAGVAAAAQEFLIDAYPPLINAAGDAQWSVITGSGVAGTLLIPAASSLASAFRPASPGDPVTGETVAVQGAAPAGDLTTLTLAAPLTRLYDRSTVTVNANAVLATHGETVQEILGSGDAANPALTFTLRQAPLTYLTVPAGSGAQSTLQVWVNNLRWREAPTLLAAGPADRVYTTRVNAAGNTVVQFGDGTHGARPPTGQANIRAVYRKGTGLAGMVRAGQLSQPLDRPQGLSAVTNPGAASLGADPATADEVRASAPLPTLTISRVVSLQDYQDYALGFAGIALAQATWTWTGGLRGIMVTVAGTGGSVLSPADPVVASLLTALRTSGDPNLPLTVAAHRPALFTFAAAVAVDSASFDPAAVRAQAWQAVSAVFAFGRRSLGQGVAASEVIAVIQAVPGVTAVRLTGLRRSGQPPAGAAVLRASGPQPPAGTQPAAGAELLVLDPATQGQIGAWQ
jgi:hypothetical protein